RRLSRLTSSPVYQPSGNADRRDKRVIDIAVEPCMLFGRYFSGLCEVANTRLGVWALGCFGECFVILKYRMPVQAALVDYCHVATHELFPPLAMHSPVCADPLGRPRRGGNDRPRTTHSWIGTSGPGSVRRVC